MILQENKYHFEHDLDNLRHIARNDNHIAKRKARFTGTRITALVKETMCHLKNDVEQM